MNHVMYTELGFQGNAENYYDENNSYINKVKIWISCVIAKRFLLLFYLQVYLSCQKY